MFSLVFGMSKITTIFYSGYMNREISQNFNLSRFIMKYS